MIDSMRFIEFGKADIENGMAGKSENERAWWSDDPAYDARHCG
jgi:hypothetical protein